MHDIVEKLLLIKAEIKELLLKKTSKAHPNVIVVCKTFPMDNIIPLIDKGHIHFGENKVQEAASKWNDIRSDNLKIKLHMIGKLQSNKVKAALKIFDYIHSVDSYKLAEKIAKYSKEQGKNIETFVQVNIGMEPQKGGINPKDVIQFVSSCKKNLSLKIIGLMGIPPANEDVEKYFKQLNQLKEQSGLEHLSMGMSNDYQAAIKYGSTFLRIGSKILGERNKITKS